MTLMPLQAHINVPPPAPPGAPVPPESPPITVPTPEGIPPEIDEPSPEPMLPIREPGVIRPPQAAHWLHGGGFRAGRAAGA